MYVDGNSRVGEGKIFATKREYEQSKKIRELKEALIMTQNLCYTIVDSSPETTIKGKIESMALELGHHPCVLNANNIEDE